VRIITIHARSLHALGKRQRDTDGRAVPPPSPVRQRADYPPGNLGRAGDDLRRMTFCYKRLHSANLSSLSSNLSSPTMLTFAILPFIFLSLVRSVLADDNAFCGCFNALTSLNYQQANQASATACDVSTVLRETLTSSSSVAPTSIRCGGSPMVNVSVRTSTLALKTSN
jgi:hypothetical protein